MSEYVDFLPLFQEQAETVRARMDADANAGIISSDARYVDTREGLPYHDITEPLVLEFARLWDALAVEVPAAAFPAYAWGDYLDAHAEVFGMSRKPGTEATGIETFTGDNGTFVPTGTEVGSSADGSGVTPPTFVTTEDATITTGSVDIPIVATGVGTAYNVGVGAVTELNSSVPGVDSVTNADPTVGGTEVESDPELRTRLLSAYQGAGAGTVSDYERWALSQPGVGEVFVMPLWLGAGTVQVVVMDDTGHPVSGTVVTAVQDYLDPVAGEGKGQAPIGAVVTVQTPAVVTANIAATVVLKDGYSLTGSGGTIAVDGGVTAALSRYIDALAVGDDVVLHHAEAQFFAVAGIYDVSAITINGVAADLAITSDPAQIAHLGTVTLTT